MTEAAAQAHIEERRTESIQSRKQLATLSVTVDVLALLTSLLVADYVLTHALPSIHSSLMLALPAGLLVLFGLPTYFASGLYEPEAYVSRPLHLWTLLRASVITYGLAALAFFLVRPHAFANARFIFLLAFAIYVVVDVTLRVGLLDRLSVAWLKRHRAVSLLIGAQRGTDRLSDRLSDLRGFNRVECIEVVGSDVDVNRKLSAALERFPATSGKLAAVFVDVASMTPEEAYRAAVVAQRLGAEVYMVSPLLDAVEGGRILAQLFDAPVVRLRRRNERRTPYALKRAFDIVGSAALLLLASPVIAVLAIAIKLSSPGPVFYTQTRVGENGETFEFLKMRSMVVNNDEDIHSEYVKAFMNGTAETFGNDDGEKVFKKLDDPRITPVGRIMRKYSLDELPQFWNVLRGDMSLVGPRPALPYEVAEYDDFDQLRMAVPAGITGLWQVKGRSRVTFDEMILQDLVYAQNARLLVDIELSLSTLPAALLGGGGG